MPSPGYQPLARRYRPAALMTMGRVYEPTNEHPYTLTLRPFHGGLLVIVECTTGERSRFIPVSDMDATVVHDAAAAMYQEIRGVPC